MTRWYRAYEGTATDPKLGEVALVAECSRSVAIAVWHCILESAAAENRGGKFATTPRRIAVILGESPSVVERVMGEMQSLGMVGNESVTAWQRRQYESDSSTERSRKHRQRVRDDSSEVRNGDATLQQQPATPSENREQRAETERHSERPSGRVAGATGRADPAPDCPHEQIVQSFHERCPTLPRVRDWTDSRRASLRRLWREKPERQRIEFWHEFFGSVGRSPFLIGGGERNWTADIDWLLKPANFQKVIEGKFDPRPHERFGKTTQQNIRAVEGFVNAVNGR